MVKLAVTELEVMGNEEGPKGLDELVKIFNVMLRCGPTGKLLWPRSQVSNRNE